MIRPVNIKDDRIDNTENARPKQKDGMNYMTFEFDKKSFKIIKEAMQNLEDRTYNTKYYDPVRDVKEIQDIRRVAEEVRKAYDEISTGT